MARKITPLKHIYPKDQRAISILAKSGAISKETFNKLQISDNRIKSYRDAGLIKEVSVPNKHGDGFRNFYELTEKHGKDFARSECGVTHFISNANASIHNASVSAYLVDNLSKKELDTCLSERELSDFISDRLNEYLNNQEQDHYQELLDALQNNQLSLPDIVYKTEQGTYEAIEITTDSYGREEIDSKLMTCKLLNIEITFVEAH